MIETFFCSAPDGAATGARLSGTRGPALVFVHGVGSTAAIWDYQLRAFGDRARCMAMELRGNGVPKPEPDPALISRKGFADDVLAVADAQGAPTFTIVGCSLGGVVAFELWKRAPERIEAMVIVGSFAAYPNARAYADGIKAAVEEANGMAAFAQLRAARLGLPPDRLRETIDQMGSKTVPSYLASTDATWTGDYTNMLPTIDVPVLVAAGERDTIAPLALSQVIASSIPGAELAVIPDAGHVANADNPAFFNGMLERFLGRAVAAR
ncbi:MAG: alpha/beta fold hydrolase [Candidatus Eremiobacteraeota bacterium]|nr:alpha/beta fold hydrolase [Candidatus Eremiobacteraeota bacterium]